MSKRWSLPISRRGATNVVATMLIFGIMIASVGVLYSQIAPTLLGYETTATTTNQSFIFQSVANEVTNLVSTTEGTVSRLHIVSEHTKYDIGVNNTLNITVHDSDATIMNDSSDIATFKSIVNGSFQPSSSPSYENRVAGENTFINNGTSATKYVLKSDYSYSEGIFTMYFRARINVHAISEDDWQIDITIIQIDYLDDNNGQPIAFPLDLDEWTLRLNRRATITQTNSFQNISPGAISISHSLNEQIGEEYQFPAVQGNVEVNIIKIPILFGL